jgi:hypothetical protein
MAIRRKVCLPLLLCLPFSAALAGAEGERQQRLNQELERITAEKQALSDQRAAIARQIEELNAIAASTRAEIKGLPSSTEADMARPIAPSPDARTAGLSDGLAVAGDEIETLTRELAATRARLDHARHSLIDIKSSHAAAAVDIDAVRTKIVDALQTVAPFRRDEARSRGDHDGLTSREIIDWAATIAAKYRHETPVIEDMLATGEALDLAALHAAPNRHAARITVLAAGSAVVVTGKVADGAWYRIETRDGHEGFVRARLIRRLKSDHS